MFTRKNHFLSFIILALWIPLLVACASNVALENKLDAAESALRQGNLDDAVAKAKEALVLAEGLDKNSALYAHTLADLGVAYFYQLRFSDESLSEAKLLLQKALSIYESQPDSNHRAIATVLGYLAWIHPYQGLFCEGEPIYERALGIRESLPEAEQMDLDFSNIQKALMEADKYRDGCRHFAYNNSLGSYWKKTYADRLSVIDEEPLADVAGEEVYRFLYIEWLSDKTEVIRIYRTGDSFNYSTTHRTRCFMECNNGMHAGEHTYDQPVYKTKVNEGTISGELWAQLLEKIKCSGFWTVRETVDYMDRPMDGESWLLEARRGDNYRLVERFDGSGLYKIAEQMRNIVSSEK